MLTRADSGSIRRGRENIVALQIAKTVLHFGSETQDGVQFGQMWKAQK